MPSATMVCVGPDHRQHPGTQRGHSAPRPPPDTPPASHPIPPTDPALWHTGLVLPTMSLTQHPAVTGPVCTSVTEPLLFCLVSLHQNYLSVSVLRTQLCRRVRGILISSSSPEFFRFALKVLLNLKICQVLYRTACHTEYTRCMASPALCIIRQLWPPPNP